MVDNGSFDGCGERLGREHPGVKFLQSYSNLGFACANNLGVQQSSGEVLLFLNPDTVVLDRAIEKLYRHFLTVKKPGVIGCRLLNTDGSVQTSCVQARPTVLNQVLDAEILRHWFPRSKLWGTKVLYEAGQGLREVEAVSGACMMIRREVFDRVNGFSSEYFMYAEDLDLCFKAERAGFRNYHLDEAVVVHHGGGSSERTINQFCTVMTHESMNLFLRNSRGGLYSSFYRLSMSGAAVVRLAVICLLFPAWRVFGQTGKWNIAFRKWLIALRWGLGLERWTRQYKQENQCSGRQPGAVEISRGRSSEN